MRHHLWFVLGSVAASSTMLAACDGPSDIKIRTSSTTTDDGVLKVVEGLQCPQTLGVLTRQGSASADGRACNYVGPRGSEVELQLIDLKDGSAQSVLKSLEARLSAKIPQTKGASAPDAPKAPDAPDSPTTGHDDPITEHASVEMPGLQVHSEGERSTVRLPGMKIEADGDRSEVRIGGIVIRSDNRSETSQVTVSNPSGGQNPAVQIDSDGSTTRVRRQTHGEAIRANYRLITKSRDDRGQQSWHSVGYEARGPAGGPMVVAVVKSRADNDDRVFDAARDLVTLNVGD